MNISLYLRVSGSWWREALSHTIGTMRGPNTPVKPPRVLTFSPLIDFANTSYSSTIVTNAEYFFACKDKKSKIATTIDSIDEETIMQQFG